VRLSSRRPDDADVIRARLRALLEDRDRDSGWVPDDASDDDVDPPALQPPPSSAGDAEPETLGRHRAPAPTVRWSPGRRGSRSLWLAALGAAVVLVGWTWFDRPSVEPVVNGSTAAPAISSTPPAATPTVGEVSTTTPAIVVSVVGLVARPGLVTLPAGARVADAIEAAGGFLPEADTAMVNLAALVTDGQQVSVGVPAAPGASAGPAGSPAAGGKIDLNAATAADLDALPGIGPVLAQRIVDHRAQHGPFRSVDDLDDVPGIGPAIFGELVDLVVVAG
jgi:competence protein ComEA